MSLESYWKLVSADAGERTGAAHDLVASLQKEGANSGAGSWDEQLPPNVDYAVKRLVRGLSSSTEAARQGFAACLAELLSALPAIPLSVVREHMLASTEITGSVRGQEERDLLLGRLFTCLAVARSGRLVEDLEAWAAVGGELLELATGLFAKRKVLRSLAGHTVVALVAQMPPAVFTAHPAVERLGAALGRGGKAGSGKDKAEAAGDADAMDVDGGASEDGEEEEEEEDLPVEELNPDQLLVALAVHAYLREHGLLKQAGALEGKLPGWLLASKRLLKAKRVPKLVEPLKASSAAFPQVHPVWDRLLDEVLGAGADGDEAAFTALWAVVVDGTLAKGTHERKALSLMLLQKVAPRVSAAQLGGCLSPNVLKVLLAALSTAGTADQVLQPLAKQTLEALLALAAGDENGDGDGERRLAVASGLMARCDVNFDMKTGTKAVQGLLEGLGPKELLAFVRQLARDFEAASGAAAEAQDDGEDVEGDQAAAAATAVARQVWAVDALYALSKSPALAGSGEEGAAVVVQILRLLLALAYFDTAGLKADEAKDGGKKRASSRSKKGAAAAASSVAVEGEDAWVIVKPQGPVAKEVRRVAAARLHSLLADLGKRGGGGGAALRFERGGGLGWLWALHQAWEGLEGRGAVLAAPLAEEARAARASMLALVGEIRGHAEEENRMAAAFAALVMQVGLHQLRVPASDEEGEVEDDGVLGDLCRCYADLAAQQAARQKKAKAAKGKKDKGKGKKQADEEDEEKEDVDPMAVLADVCVSALSSASGRDGVAVRGLREMIRKAWGLVCGSCPLTRAAMDVLLGVVCKTPAGEGEGEGGESGSDEEEDEDDEDEEEDQEALAVLDRALQSAGVVNGNGGSSSDEEEESEGEESVVVDGNDPAAFLQVLGGPAEGQVHLDSMLALKQASRQGSKTSRAERERAELQLRLRALDLLEVAVAKQPQSPFLLLAVRPCLRALRRLQAQGAGPGWPSEAADLAKRLGDFLEKRLVGKARPKLCGSEGRLPEEEVQALVTALLGDLRKATTQAQTALLVSCLTLCARAVLAAAATAAASEGGASQGTAPEWLAERYREALADFLTKRTALTAAPFEQLVARFPSAAALVLLPSLPRLGAGADKAFRQAEAFRLVGLLLGQRKVLGPEGAAALQGALGEVLTGLGAVLSKGEGELASKRLKPLVDCAQAVAQALEAGQHAAEAAELAGVLEKAKAATASEAVQKQCATVARLLVGGGDGDDEEEAAVDGGKKKKGKKGGQGKGGGDKKRKYGEKAEQKSSKMQKAGTGKQNGKGIKA